MSHETDRKIHEFCVYVCIRERGKVWGSGKLFFTKECQLRSAEGIDKARKSHFTTSSVILDLGRDRE